MAPVGERDLEPLPGEAEAQGVVGEDVVGLTPEGPGEEEGTGAPPDRGAGGELGVGGVLVPGVALPLQVGVAGEEGGGARVEVPHPEVGKPAERLGVADSAVGGDDEFGLLGFPEESGRGGKGPGEEDERLQSGTALSVSIRRRRVSPGVGGGSSGPSQ